ncbi:MAG: AAA family ATPase [Clostridiales bacterium]|nr:AAA family ATPase [Clostridiales bacterium]
MKINEVTLFEYGKFDNKKVIKLSENRPNLIYGKNEAGKSTIVSAISELIFGFERSKKDNHKYLPWKGERLNIAMSYLNSAGKKLNVKRLLSNNVKAAIEDGLEIIQLNNRTLPDSEYMSRNIFNNVYMITSEQLKEIETKSFSELQDKLVLNYGNSNVSPKAVIQQLDEDIKNLYNARSRGNKQTINQLIDEIKELKREKKDKSNQYHEVRVMSEDIQKLDKELLKLDEKIIEKVNLKNQINRYLKPIDLINKIENLKANVENYERYERLDKEILEKYQSLKEILKEYRDEISEKDVKVALKKEKIEELSYDEKMALSLKDRLEEIESVELKLDKVKDNIDKNNEYFEMNVQKMHNEVDYLFKEKIRNVVDFDFQKIQTLYYKSKEDESNNSKGPLAIFKVLVILGLLGVGIFTQNIFGAAVLAITLLIVIFDYFDRREKLKSSSSVLLKKELITIGIVPEIAENFTEINLKNLENYQTIRIKTEELLNLKQELGKAELKCLREYDEIFTKFDDIRNVKMLNHVLSEAVAKSRLNDELMRDIEQENNGLHQLAQKTLEKDHEYTMIENTINKMGNGNFEIGYSNIEKYLSVRDRIIHYESELAENFNMSQIEEEIDNLDQSIINEDYLIVIENDIESLQLEKTEKAKRNIQLKAEIDHKITGDTLDVIEGKIEYKTHALKEYAHQYDILSILKQLIVRADERYREKNQPDVLKLTSYYFSKMTNGKYTHVLIEEDEKMYLKDQEGEIVSADSEISAGTKNQLYLSFRLALIKYLDQDKDKLPIILDEAFSNWDVERLDPTLKLIEEISKERQVIMFTCKEHNVKYLESYLPDLEKIII